jgi:hypothetical protein
LRSDTAGGTIGATEDAVRDDCAYPNLVRSRPEANTRPPTNAATRAPAKVRRVIGFDFMAALCLKVFIMLDLSRLEASGSSVEGSLKSQ